MRVRRRPFGKQTPSLIVATVVGGGGAALAVSCEVPARFWVLAGVTAVSLGVLLAGLRRNRPRYRLPWVLFAVAVIAGGCGAVYSALLTEHATAPLGGPLDGVVAIGVVHVVTVVGLLLLVRGERRARRLVSAVLDGAIVALLWGYLAWEGFAAEAVGELTERAGLGVALVVASSMVVGLAVALFRSSGASRVHWAVLGGAVGLGVADLLWLVEPWSGRFVVATLAVGTTLYASAALSPEVTDPAAWVPSPRQRLSVAPLLPYLLAPAVPVVLLVMSVGDDYLAAAVVLGAVLVGVARVGVLVTDLDWAVAESRADLEASERRFRLLAEAAPDAIWRLVYDPTPHYAYLSPASEAVYGTPPERIHGPLTLLEQVVDQDRAVAVTPLFVRPAGGHEDTFRIRHPDGTIHRLRRRYRGVRDVSGEVVAVEGITTDVTDWWRLTEQATRLAEIVDSVPDLIFDVSDDGSVRPANAAARLLVHGEGGGADEPGSPAVCRIDDVLTPASARTFADEVLPAVDREGLWRGQLDVAWGGAVRPCSAVVVAGAGEDGTATGRRSVVLRDISELRETEHRLHRLATTDPLTGLANRAALATLLDHLDEAVPPDQADPAAPAGSPPQMWPYTVIYLDLDGLKACNDRHGHAAGDGVLVAVAEVIRKRLRPGEVACRIGGDEFAVVLVGASEADGVAFGERLVAALETPLPVERQWMRVTGSVGVATVGPGESAHNVLRRADEAMFRAKRLGRSRVVVGPSTGAIGIG